MREGKKSHFKAPPGSYRVKVLSSGYSLFPLYGRTQRHSVSDDDGTLAQNMAQCSRKELREAAARHIVQPIANIIQKTINEGQPLVGDDASHNTQSADDEDVKQSPAGDVDPVRGSKEVEQTTNNGRLKQSDKNRKLDTGDKDEKGSGVNAVGQTAKDVKPENKGIQSTIVICSLRDMFGPCILFTT